LLIEKRGEARKRFPFSVATYNTDNGGENEKRFAKELGENAVFHFYSEVGKPTDNPRVERSHRTDEEEFYRYGIKSKGYEDQKEAMKNWEYVYNYVRPHQALSYLTPMEFYELWKESPKKAYKIKDKYQKYLKKQRKRLANARKIKKKEQIEALMNFIDAKLSKKPIKQHKQSLINCQLCSWT
jgi:transposase InsO family protein